MSSSRQFTDVAGRTFFYSHGRRVYLDGGCDSGAPVPYRPEPPAPQAPRPLTPPASPSAGLLLENEKLSSMLSRYLRVNVSVTSLLGRETFADLLGVVLPLIADPGATAEERRALEDKISRISLAAYRWAIHRVICHAHCSACGARLGARALHLGREATFEMFDDLHQQNPGRLISAVRQVDAVCPRCRAGYLYTDERTLVRVNNSGS